MGIKSRGNYSINFCLKMDCVFREIKCKECIRYSEYKKLFTKEKSNELHEKK